MERMVELAIDYRCCAGGARGVQRACGVGGKYDCGVGNTFGHYHRVVQGDCVGAIGHDRHIHLSRSGTAYENGGNEQ